MSLAITMEGVGGVDGKRLLVEQEHGNEPVTSTQFTLSSVHTDTQPDFISSSSYDPCFDSISNHVCVNYLQLTIIFAACLAIVFMIGVRILFCCMKRRRHPKRDHDIFIMEDDTIVATISALSSVPPPRYSQIFDQDGISVFEEAPPEYETAEPDLLKSLTQDLSRTSSQTSRGECAPKAAKEKGASKTSGNLRNAMNEAVQDKRMNSLNETVPSSGTTEPANISVIRVDQDPTITLSVDSLSRDTRNVIRVL